MLKRNPDRKPILPGKILKELFLKDRCITIKDFSYATGVTPKHMSNIINGKGRIEADLATRIAAVLGTSIEVWMNLQKEVDIWNARQKMKNWKPKMTFFKQEEVRV